MRVFSYFSQRIILDVTGFTLDARRNNTKHTDLLFVCANVYFCNLYLYLRESQIDFNIKLITNFRLVLNIFIFVCIYNTESYDIETILLLVIISLILDGADGYLSRHLNQMTLFGKTFDQGG